LKEISTSTLQYFNTPTLQHMKTIFNILILLVFSGCYSFKGISIPPEVNTFSVSNFEVQALNAPANIDQIFTEDLRNKVRNESRLNLNNVNGDVQFSGAITEYNIVPVAAQPGEVAELNRLQISVSTTYTSLMNEEDNWTQKFTRFEEYNSSEDLSALEETLIESINEQLVEDIFNKAFNNW